MNDERAVRFSLSPYARACFDFDLADFCHATTTTQRCGSLAAAQAPLSDLSEKLMEQLKGKEAAAAHLGALEEHTKVRCYYYQ